ncbi:Nonribosomal peptide synthetase TES [Fulvia fulva]|nr:Nonribosomal peptide synthetase TES [Fulvia fulva]KAK4612933.1 Nonribosomal peptide synthetase TES [Fulvia fulva]WPV21498.1 Nonribosomal peptide synthetase TES [Fulvia fulva]WPV36457.1 Nonribosomal peptide synthetase TES [Fulvia fulva]
MALAFGNMENSSLVVKDHRAPHDGRTKDSLLGRIREEAPPDHCNTQSFGRHDFKVERSLCQRLQVSSALHEYDLKTVLFAAFRAALYRTTGASDLTVGILSNVTSAPGNIGHDDVHDTQLHSISTKIEDNTRFVDLLQQAKGRLDQARDLDLGISAEATLSQSTLRHADSRIIFALRERPIEPDSHITKLYPSSDIIGSDIIWHFWLDEEGGSGNVYFANRAIDRDSIISLVSVFLGVLESGSDDPTTSCAQLLLLSNFSSIVPDPSRAVPKQHTSVCDAFREQVTRHPNTIAVKDSSQTLTYSELDTLSQKISNWLARRRCAAETMIGVLAGRSVVAVTTYIGILGANHAYVPLDIRSPVERLNHMLSSMGNQPLVLYGPGLESLAARMADAEYVSIAQILDDNVPVTPVEHMLPLPATLAAVIFTSGSTGRPKGVMIEHRAIVRVAKQESYQITPHSAEETSVVAHLLNPAFDAAMMEIYTALLNGHTLYCVDESILLDSHSLSEAFVRQSVKMAVFTPALLDHCLREAPVLFKQLKILVVGGDRFKASHARQLKRLVQGEVFNGYGPTENTVVSTLYRIPADDEHISDDVPIGQAVTGSFAIVADTKQRMVPVPPGVIGELIVGGDGLARGYLDTQLNVDRFVQISINGTAVRAYRTGDLARLRPSDMQLQFMGRIDHQVKIRGHRVEVDEIDRVLMSHSAIDSATTILYIPDNAEELDLVSFVTKSPGSRYADLGLDLAISNLGRDFVGWTSMYDGTLIPRHEMEEWLEDTIRTIQESCPGGALGKVLEVGTGSGMMLFNLTPMSTQYVGLEPSLDAVNFVNSAIESIADIKGKARVHQGTASGIGRWMDDCQPDLVVINSVSMYFPSAAYIYKIIEDCIGQLRPYQKTRLFFGDVRSYALYHEFLTHKACHNAVAEMTIGDLCAIVDEQMSREKEMLIDPGLFTALPVKFSGSIEHVEILPKRMHATNELSCFRYAAVVHMCGAAASPSQVHELAPDEWMDVSVERLDRAAIEKQLMVKSRSSSSSDIVLALSSIPYSKIAADKAIVDAIRVPGALGQQVEDLTKRFHEHTDAPLSWDAAGLHQLAKAAGLEVQVSWARQYSQRGGMDAVFFQPRGEMHCRRALKFPVDHDNRDPRTLCNQPIQVDGRIALQQELEVWARDKLPPYMMPRAVLVIDQMPLTNNGKVDHKKLAKMAASEFAAAIKRDSARNPPTRSVDSSIETKLKELWAMVLDVPVASIAADDHFVRKGGDSIKAMRLAAAARRHGLTLKIPGILTSPRLRDMARTVHEEAVEQQFSVQPATHIDVAPFEMLQYTSEAEARSSAMTQCDISAHSIEDIFPCTPLQAGLVALNLANPSDYIGRHVKQLLPTTGIERFQVAFGDVVRAHPILRSRIIYLPGDNFVQVVTKSQISWSLGTSVEEYTKKDRQNHMGLGQPLVRAAVITEGTQRYFILTAHHSLFDGWSMRILFDALDRAYHSLPISPPPPFQNFIKALVQHNQSEAGKQAWRANLMDNEAEQFPRLPNPGYRPKSDSLHHCRFQDMSWGEMDVTAAVAVRAALAILISQRENVQDVVFGTALAGRDSIPVAGIEEMTGPTLTTLLTRVTFACSQETVGDFLVRLQNDWAALSRYEHMGLAAIRDLSEDAHRATEFQTLLVVQPSKESLKHGENGHSLFKHEASVRAADNDLGAISTYAMVMECQLSKNGVDIRVTFDSAVVPEAQMRQMLSQYETILRKLCLPEAREQRLSEIEWLGEIDMSAIWKCNATMPEAIESATHDLLSSTIRQRPSAQAIAAWDGDLTYEELDGLSTRLADHLLDHGVVDAVAVAIYIEKSKWTAVAMLAVMKAGGTSCLLDPSLPVARLQSMVDQLGPRIILASPRQRVSAQALFKELIVVVDAANATQWSSATSGRALPSVDPATPLYVVFTSGSTGAPKGVVISHGSFSSAIVHQHPRRSVGEDSRVYDFSSLAFDGSWFNLLHTLYAGGCVCIPSDTDRQNDLSGSILRLGATFAFLTPTVASTLDIAALRALESLEIGGEAADEDEMQRIQVHTSVRFIYGPSECTPITTMTKPGAHALSIGRPAGVLAWLVDPQHTERLVGVGCIAELWLEGPLVGTGYYKDPNRTAASFVENPPWLLRDRPGRPGRKGRAYRTGDLVRYQPDGSLTFVGRNNMQQVKVRGQRVELLDVQHNVQDVLKKSLPEVSVIADVCGPKKDTLVAFVHVQNKSWAALSFNEQTSLLREKAGNAKNELAGMVPKYMIPALFVPLESFPLSPTGKLDRRRLQAMPNELTQEQRNACSLLPSHDALAADQSRSCTEEEVRSPCTEEKLRSLWAMALNIDAESITTEDNFFHRGGDSLLAMKLVNAARRAGVSLSVADVWTWPQLSSLAAHVGICSSTNTSPGRMVEPATAATVDHDAHFSMTLPSETLPSNKPPSSETLPVTWSQYQFLNGTVNGYSAHVYHLLVDIPAGCDKEQVKNACSRLLHDFDVLRVRFVCSPYRVHQVFDDYQENQLPWQELQANDLDTLDTINRFCEADRATLGARPHPQTATTRFVLMHRQQRPHKLVMRLCHAQYDGVSIPRMLSTLTRLLHSGTAPAPPRSFADYLRYVLAQSPESYPYWRKLLQGTKAPTVIPSTKHRASVGVHLIRVSHTIPQPTIVASSAQTPAVRFLASCAAMLAQTTATRDVVFGCIISGRSSVPEDLQDVCGPCLNEIPVRVTFSDCSLAAITPQSAFEVLRQQMLESSAHDAVGFDEIAAHCTCWGEEVDDFGLTAHYQNSANLDLGVNVAKEISCVQHEDDLPVPKANYIEVEAVPLPDKTVRMSIMGKSSHYDERFLARLLHMVCGNYRM